jgi:hypothetical protein
MAKVPSNKGETDHKLRRFPGTTENQIPMISLSHFKGERQTPPYSTNHPYQSLSKS